MTCPTNKLRSRYGPVSGRWSDWIVTECTPSSETDNHLGQRHLGEDVFPQMNLSGPTPDRFLHTEWISGGELITVDTQQGEFDDDETVQEWLIRDQATVLAKLELFPVDP